MLSSVRKSEENIAGKRPAMRQDYKEARRLLDAGELDRAESIVVAAISRRPKKLRLRLIQGLILERRGDQDQAEEHYRRLIADFPGAPDPPAALAALALSRGDVNLPIR